MPTLTIDFTAAQAQRIQNAFKVALNVDTFTMADYKQWVITQTKSVVTYRESQAAAAALPQPDTFDPA